MAASPRVSVLPLVGAQGVDEGGDGVAVAGIEFDDSFGDAAASVSRQAVIWAMWSAMCAAAVSSKKYVTGTPKKLSRASTWWMRGWGCLPMASWLMWAAVIAPGWSAIPAAISR